MRNPHLLLFSIIGLLACADPPADPGCRLGNQTLAPGEYGEDYSLCQACLCTQAAELQCEWIAGCVAGGDGGPPLPPPNGGDPGEPGYGDPNRPGNPGEPGTPGPGAGEPGTPGNPNNPGGDPNDPGGDGDPGRPNGTPEGGDPENPGGGDDPYDPPGGDCPRGGAVGLACAPDGSPIVGAVASAETTDCNGNPVVVEARSGENGRFRIDGLAPGPHTIRVVAGRFDETYDVVIEPNDNVAIDEQSGKECLPTDAAKVAVLSGDYDHIESIIGRLGFEHDLFCSDSFGNFGGRHLLGNWAALTEYDILFINCGATVRMDGPGGQQIVANLRRFAEEGGAIYISDLAAYVIEAAWPQAITFRSERTPPSPGAGQQCCECIDCPPMCGGDINGGRALTECKGSMGGGLGELQCEHVSPLLGRGQPGIRFASVDSPELQGHIGRANQTVTFELEGWVEIASTGPDTEVLVSDNGQPLMVSFPVGHSGGRVTFTTFHNSAQLGGEVADILRGLVFQL